MRISKLVNLVNNKVVQNVIIVGGITLIIKAVSFYKEVLVAGEYGLSELLDTFILATIIPSLINAIFLASFRAVFVPSYMAEEKTGNKIGSFQSVLLVVTLISCLLLILISYLVSDYLLEDIFPNHTAAYYQLVRDQLYIVIPSVFFWGLSSVLSGILNINKEYRFSSFSSVFIPLTIIISLVFFRDVFGKYLLAWSTFLGSVVSFVYLFILVISKNLIVLGRPNFRNENVRIMVRQIPAKLTSSFLTGMQTVVDQYFAAQLVIGSVSALNYGIKLPSFIISLLIIAITNVLLPHFTEATLENRKLAFQKLFKMIKTILIVTSAIAIAVILLSDVIVMFLFENNNFTPEDTEIVSRIQQIILVYVPFRTVGLLLVTFLTSINKNNLMAIVSFIGIFANITLNSILITYHGVYGIAIATTIVSVLKMGLLFYFTVRERDLTT